MYLVRVQATKTGQKFVYIPKKLVSKLELDKGSYVVIKYNKKHNSIIIKKAKLENNNFNNKEV